MITCPRCGQTIRLGVGNATTCPRCGAPLVPPSPSAGAPSGITESGIPVWLKQLQAQQQVGPGGHAGAPPPRAQPGTPAGGAPAAAPSSLVSEDALPGWLRNDTPAGAGNGAGPASPGAGEAYGSAVGFGVPAPVPAGQYAAGAPGGKASPLIDESSLPAWLRQNGNGMPAGGAGMARQGALGAGQPPFPPAYPPAYPSAGQVPGSPTAPGYHAGGMAVGSLIDERSLPAWMQQPNAARQSDLDQGTGSGRREGMDARSLVDDTSLPQWLRGAQSAGQPEATGQEGQWNQGFAPQQPAWMMQQGAAAPSPSAGAPPAASASPSVPTDDSALPPWLRAQSAAAHQAPQEALRAPLDPAAVPPWARSGASAGAGAWASSSAGQSIAGQSIAGQVAARQSPNSAWLTDAHVPAAANGANNGAGGGVAEGQLPSWLRGAQQAAQQEGSHPASGRAGGSGAEELPPWLRQGAPGQSLGGSNGRMRPDQHRGDTGSYSSSRMRARDPRQPDYGGQGYDEEEWDEEYPPEGYEPDGRRSPRQRRGGFLGFLRRH